jgi:hypothetical protein
MHTIDNGIDGMGEMVRLCLAELLDREGIDWQLHLSWDPMAIVATIHRGELAIPAFEARSIWWQPSTHAHGTWLARHLARILWRWWRIYREADETGRLGVALWQDENGGLSLQRAMEGREVEARLEPGCRVGDPNPEGRALVYRLGQAGGRNFEDALSLGWMRLG